MAELLGQDRPTLALVERLMLAALADPELVDNLRRLGLDRPV